MQVKLKKVDTVSEERAEIHAVSIFCGKITRLHLCSFWPTREIISVSLAEQIAVEEKETIKAESISGKGSR